MANQNIKIGEIYLIGKTQDIACKNGSTLQKRELFLAVDVMRNGVIVGTTYPKFTFNGQRCSLLDKFKEKQKVAVFFDIEGRFYDGGKNPDGSTIWKHSNDIGAYNIMSIEEYNDKYNGGSRGMGDVPSADVLAKQMFGASVVDVKPAEGTQDAPKDDLPF